MMNENKGIQRMTCALEKRLYKYPSLFKLYSFPYSGVVQREIELGGITSDDVVLNVGCGPLPFTAVHIAEMSGAKVFAVDNDKRAVKLATELVKKLGLSNLIEVLECDGKEHIPVDFNKAVMALHVEPKMEVLKNLLTRSDVVMRSPRGSLKESYGLHSMHFTPSASTKHLMPTFDRSYLFTDG